MSKRIKYQTIFNYRLNEWSDNVDSNSVNAGAARGLFIIIPFVAIVGLFEFIWLRIFGGDYEKYNNKP